LRKKLLIEELKAAEEAITGFVMLSMPRSTTMGGLCFRNKKET
jgi:hypothetical protein